MSTTDSVQLLRAYAERGDEAAFRELVARTIDLVYATALRRVGNDAELARDVTQTVFTDLARKARSLRGDVMLGGWLHHHTGFVAATAVRGERRRQTREQQAAEMNALQDSPDSIWQQLSPCLDETIDALEAPDRQAIVLRFFERRDFNAIGAALGISDDAAQKRVSRALEKLRAMLVQRGVTLGVTLLAGLMAGKVVGAAPAGLATSVSRAALAAVAPSAGIGVALMKLMSSLTFKLAVGTAAVVAVALLLSRPSEPSAAQREKGVPSTGSIAQPQASGFDSPTAGTRALTAERMAVVPIETGETLRLRIFAADSGEPVANATIDYYLRRSTNNTRSQFQSTALGTCEVPCPRETVTELRLTTQIDGFADTSLQWKSNQFIPVEYTLKLTRPVRIGGRVVTVDGQPVTGATVAFNDIRRDVSSDSAVERHVGSRAVTDADGQWSLNRLAPEIFRQARGIANHSNFVDASVSIADAPEAEKQLLAGTHVFHLDRAISIQGVVVDADGRPVPDATVRVVSREMGLGRMKTATTLADGSFSIADCKPGLNEFRASAEGNGSSAIEVEVAEKTGPIRVTLKRGFTLKLRFVNKDGTAATNTRVMLVDISDPSPTQVRSRGTTDTDGRFTWDHAPDATPTLDIQAQGHMLLEKVKLQADGQEREITLPPALTIFGTVRDAISGELIPQFRIATGLPSRNVRGSTSDVFWSPSARFQLSFKDGTFQHSYEGPVVRGGSYRAFIFKFMAEGYAPFVTRKLEADEGEVHLDIRLRPVAETTVAVLLPDGRPAGHTDIGFASPGARLELVPGGVSRQNIQSSGALTTTDAEGRFRLTPDATITRVIAANDEGFAEATPTVLAAQPILRLQPWGRLEGTFLSGGKPGVGRMLSLSAGLSRAEFELARASFHVMTDADGRFVFPKVPHGRFRLNSNTRLPADGATWSTISGANPLADVVIRPGETNSITLGTHKVTAHVRWPVNLQREVDWHLNGTIEAPDLHQFSMAREIAGGILVAEDLIAGSYRMKALVLDGSGRIRAQAAVPVTIPADSPSSTFDLGEIALQADQ